MDVETRTDSRSVLEELNLHLAALKSNPAAVDSFNTWFFMNSAWDSRSDSETLLDLGSAIRHILYQWQDFPNLLTASDVVEAIDSAVTELSVTVPPVIRSSMDSEVANFGSPWTIIAQPRHYFRSLGRVVAELATPNLPSSPSRLQRQ